MLRQRTNKLVVVDGVLMTPAQFKKKSPALGYPSPDTEFGKDTKWTLLRTELALDGEGAKHTLRTNFSPREYVFRGSLRAFRYED